RGRGERANPKPEKEESIPPVAMVTEPSAGEQSSLQTFVYQQYILPPPPLRVDAGSPASNSRIWRLSGEAFTNLSVLCPASSPS
ncbi:hypothetical protein JOQ06_009334, partial [Pogonophryne albipinna]